LGEYYIAERNTEDMMESNNTKTRKTMRKRNEPKRTIVKNRMMEMAKANNQMTRKMRGGKIVSNLPAQFFQQSDGKFESFEENVKEASQKKILKEAEGKSLIAAYPGSYFKTGNCVDDMCSTEELTTACMNSLGIVTLEHQDYEDYKKVMELYDKMSEEEQKAVVEANLLSLRTYLADLFKKESGQDDLLTDEKKLALKAMLETINPFYYNYLIFTDKLPEPMRTAIYEEMLQTRNLKDPLELLKLFLNYYNTVNPYRMKGAVGSDGDDMVGKRLNEYLYDNFKVSEISPSPYSAHRYNDLEIWDLEGILRTVSVPMYKMERGKELVKVIQETYGDSFKRPNPLWLIKNNPEWKIGDPESKKTIDYWVDMRYGMEQIEVNDVSEYADRAFYDFMELLARKAGVPKAEWPTNEQIKDVTRQEKIPEEGSAMYKWIELPLVRKVFAVLGISIYYRFFNVFEVGSLGGENFEDKKLLSGLDYGLFGYFSTANLRYEFECGHINITNLKDDYKINMGEAAALRLFLKQRAPMYFDRYPEAFLTKTKEGESSDDGKEVDLLETHPGERPDSLRVIRLDQDNAVTINIYEAKIMIMDEGEYMYMALIVEVNIYRNVDNTENPMDVTTDFLILWRNQKEDEAEMAFENNCKGLYEMLMKGVWSSMKKTGVIPPLEKISINPEVEERGIAEEKGENIEEGVSEEKSEVSQEKEPQSEPKGEVTDSVQEIEEEGEEETKETSPDSISGSDSKLEELTEEDFRVDHTTPFMELMEQEEDSDSESESDESVTREEEVNQEEEFTPLPRPDLPEKSPLPSSLKKPNEIPTRKNRSMMDRFRSNPNNKTKKVRVETFRNKEYPPPVN
tara:strand:- start:4387 stop:6948 length:2562 start_codon:yes stop_codon:yes gene_type:complete